MNKTFLIILFLSFISLLNANGNWLSPNSATQVKREAKDDQLGHGRLFVPAMTHSDREPTYNVFSSDGQVFYRVKTGESLFLKPGSYRLDIGSAPEGFDRIQKDFVIKEQETTIIEPEWSGLIVKVIDENREGVRMGYEIFHQNSEVSLGVKYTKADDEYDDQQTTWLLPPGKYKLVKYGESYNTILNFTTIDLKVGELKKITVVRDSKTAFIIGAGELPEEQFEFAAARDWRSYIYLRGQFSYTGNNLVSNDDHESILDFKGKVDNYVKYDKQPYYLSLRQTLETGTTKNNGDDLIISTDIFKLDNTVIYYFLKFIGIYADLDLTTKIFPSTIILNPQKTVLVNNDLNMTKVNVLPQSEFELSPSFYPLTLREASGLNFSFIKTSDANFYLRTGFGFVQKINRNVYTKENETDSTLIVKPVKNEEIKGFELAGGLDLQLPGNITYTSEGNLIYSLDGKDNYDASFDNNLKFKFLKYVSLDYSLNLKYNNKTRYLIYDNRMALEFSYYLNY